MAMNIPAIFGFIGLLVGCRADKLVSLAISQDRARPGLLTSERLFARLNVDNEDVKVVIDTRSPCTILIWKMWYETKMKGDCDKLIFKCYECNPASCKEGPVWTVPAFDGKPMFVFEHSGTFAFGNLTAAGIEFALTESCRCRPQASLGLSPPLMHLAPFRPLVYQLLAQPRSERLIESSAFSLHLKAGENPTGELILGGEDQSKFKGGLKFVIIVHKEDQSIIISGYNVGDTSQDPIMLSVTSHLNMVDSFLQLPIDRKKEIIGLLTTQGKKPLAIAEQYGFLRISCGTFLLKGSELETVPLKIQPASYTIRLSTKMCILRIEFRDDGTWSLGLPALIGFYHLYDWDRSRIGSAEVK
ncbi:hypothetical protein FOZ63_002847 [Perkinsus olseni]|uniref:Peptidase A1 domain-containing protein n=1 Tax=Perkinsus olseni TaxID=32597 RepID=A0A7J6U8J7_PEROL|nr:hypothetical protein FOZ62_031244 [Perkinsus olseni]KAF4752961.1 hypothetical protein FOZ63_002847 [Perkinsus olseni]